MTRSVDLFYLDHAGNVVSSEHVALDELMLRKLVDATLVRNQLWVHERHENNEHRQAAIYVSRWAQDELDGFGEAVERALFAMHDVSSYYEIQWHVWDGQQFLRWRCEPGEYAIRCAAMMLDHVHVFAEQHYDVQYAALDLDRRKLLVFLTKREAR